MLSLCEEYRIPNLTVSCEKEWQPKDESTFQMIVDAHNRGELKEGDFAAKQLGIFVNVYVRMTQNITPSEPQSFESFEQEPTVMERVGQAVVKVAKQVAKGFRTVKRKFVQLSQAIIG